MPFSFIPFRKTSLNRFENTIALGSTVYWNVLKLPARRFLPDSVLTRIGLLVLQIFPLKLLIVDGATGMTIGSNPIFLSVFILRMLTHEKP